MKQPNYSIIITSWKEPRTIPGVLESLLDKKVNGQDTNSEILIVAPDNETWTAASKTAKKYRYSNIKWIHDNAEGKPRALNQAFKEAKGQIFLFTDGDTSGVSKDAIALLLKAFTDKKIGGVSGQPVSRDPRNNRFGYYGHLHCAAADNHRKNTSNKGEYFPMSGYLYAIRNLGLKIPEISLAEDAWISGELYKKGYTLRYEPSAKVKVGFPKNYSDWIKQKTRSLGGNVQLSRIEARNERSILQDISMALFPLTYAKSLKELWWSLLLYQTRLSLWLNIFYRQSILKENLKNKAWDRIESSK